MPQLFREQLPLTGPVIRHRHAQELEGVDRILRDNGDTPRSWFCKTSRPECLWARVARG